MPPPMPVGPDVDTTPRPLPARVTIRGQYVTLEPLHRRHVAELWQAAQGADESAWAQNRRAEFEIPAGGQTLRRP